MFTNRIRVYWIQERLSVKTKDALDLWHEGEWGTAVTQSLPLQHEANSSDHPIKYCNLEGEYNRIQSESEQCENYKRIWLFLY